MVKKILCGFDVTAVSVVIEAIVCVLSCTRCDHIGPIKTTQIFLTTCNYQICTLVAGLSIACGLANRLAIYALSMPGTG